MWDELDASLHGKDNIEEFTNTLRDLQQEKMTQFVNSPDMLCALSDFVDEDVARLILDMVGPTPAADMRVAIADTLGNCRRVRSGQLENLYETCTIM